MSLRNGPKAGAALRQYEFGMGQPTDLEHFANHRMVGGNNKYAGWLSALDRGRLVEDPHWDGFLHCKNVILYFKNQFPGTLGA